MDEAQRWHHLLIEYVKDVCFYTGQDYTKSAGGLCYKDLDGFALFSISLIQCGLPTFVFLHTLQHTSSGEKGLRMSIVHHHHVPLQPFPGGATYQTLVGDDEGSTPVRIGIQTSPPGYTTPTHSHPYMEILTILSGTGEAWIEGQEGMAKLEPGHDARVACESTALV